MGPNPSKSLAALMRHSLDKTNKGGMADNVPAVVDGQQPAALSSGELIVPADIVSIFGDGNSEAGAEVLMSFFEEVRKYHASHIRNGEQAPMLKKGLERLFNARKN